MSTTCVYPLESEQAFRLAKLAGYDGIEVMVSQEDVDTAARAAARALPSLRAADPLRPRAGAAAHPLRVGTRPACEARAHRRARRRGRRRHRRGASAVPLAVGLRPDFLGIVREISAEHDVEIAVENMFPWRAAGRNLKAYSPGGIRASWTATRSRSTSRTPRSRASTACSSRTTSASGCGTCTSATGRARSARGRSSTSTCCPATAASPSPRCSQALAARGWEGSIVAEINTRKARSERERLELLREALEFARTHTHQTRRRRAMTRSRRALEAILPGHRH